jgi:hypothetical protein
MERTNFEKFHGLENDQKEILRQIAYKALSQEGTETGKADTSPFAVDCRCVEMMDEDAYLEVLELSRCKNCGELADEVNSEGWCPDCVEAGCICSCCNGSGEGSHDGSVCGECGGSGDSMHPSGRKRVRDCEPDDDDRDDDRAIERAEAAYEKRILG